MRYKNKHYFKIPGGEIQIGRLSKSIVVWFRGRRYVCWDKKWPNGHRSS